MSLCKAGFLGLNTSKIIATTALQFLYQFCGVEEVSQDFSNLVNLSHGKSSPKLLLLCANTSNTVQHQFSHNVPWKAVLPTHDFLASSGCGGLKSSTPEALSLRCFFLLCCNENSLEMLDIDYVFVILPPLAR